MIVRRLRRQCPSDDGSRLAVVGASVWEFDMEIEVDQKAEAVVQVALDAAELWSLTERKQAEARIREAVEALIDACRTHYRYLYAGQD